MQRSASQNGHSTNFKHLPNARPMHAVCFDLFSCLSCLQTGLLLQLTKRCQHFVEMSLMTSKGSQTPRSNPSSKEFTMVYMILGAATGWANAEPKPPSRAAWSELSHVQH